jgi:hypothetical protein
MSTVNYYVPIVITGAVAPAILEEQQKEPPNIKQAYADYKDANKLNFAVMVGHGQYRTVKRRLF